MFIGSAPPEMRLLIQEIIKDYKKPDVYIGCSGNYTIDKLAAHLGFKVHSNDVSLYSKLIADIILKQDTEIKVKNEIYAEIFSKWEESPYKKLIEVLYVMRCGEFASQKNHYEKTFYSFLLEGNLAFYNKSIKKFIKTKSLEFDIQDFFYGDFIEHIRAKRGSGVGILFPPTYKGGYEKIFNYVETVFDYEHAKYAIFDPSKSEELFKEFLVEDENIIYSDRDFEGLRQFVKGKIHIGAGKKDIFVYSSLATQRNYFFYKSKKLNNIKEYALIDPKFEFTGSTRIAVQKCRTDEVNYYKQFFMGLKVNYSLGGDLGVLFFADNKLFGFASFSKQLSDEENCFVQFDFVVPSEQKHLSKLVLYLLKSREVQDILINSFHYFYNGLKTTVYTTNPVSMKYRGVFDLDRRDEGKLIYKSKFPGGDLLTQFQSWLKSINQKSKS